MKRLVSNIYILIFFLSAFISYAQESQTPNRILGGTFAISNVSSNTKIDGNLTTPSAFTFTSKEDIFRFNFNPYFAKQINSSNMLGMELQYNHSNIKSEFGNTFMNTTTNGFGIGLFYRKYFDVLKSLSLFLQPSVNFLHSIGTTEQNAPAFQNSKSNSFTAGLSLNIAYAINNWSLFTNLVGANYSHLKSRNAAQESATRSNAVSLNTALSNFRFGIERKF